MKSHFFLFIFILFSLISCVKDANFNEPNYAEIDKKIQTKIESFNGNTISLSELKNNINSELSIYQQDDIFEGVVISSDEQGNFYKKIYVQTLDKSGSISVFIEKKGIFSTLPLGNIVQIRLKGATIWYNNRYNIIEVGYGPAKTSSGTIRIGNIPPSIFEKMVIPTNKTLLFQEVSSVFNDIKSLNKQQNVNKLITLHNVKFEAKAIGKTFHLKTNNFNTSYHLEDFNGGKLAFSTSSFANFSKEIIPNGTISVTGILTQYNGSYQLNISTLNHLQTTNN